jgi:RNA polymerase sigma-70 factor, ECF subfamily
LAIARRVVADLIRRRCRRLPEIEPSPAWTSTGVVELQAEVARLSPALREALVLTQVVGLSYQEAGVVMGVPVGTVRSRVFRARAALLEALVDEPEAAVAQRRAPS